MGIGARIKEERERLGMTQQEFAAIGGASKNSQINWEKDTDDGQKPNAAVLEAWAAAGADIVYMVTGDRMDVDKPATWAMFFGAYVDQIKGEGTPQEKRELKNAAFMELAKRAPTKDEFFLLANYRRLDGGARKMVFDMAAALIGAKVK